MPLTAAMLIAACGDSSNTDGPPLVTDSADTTGSGDGVDSGAANTGSTTNDQSSASQTGVDSDGTTPSTSGPTTGADNSSTTGADSDSSTTTDSTTGSDETDTSTDTTQSSTSSDSSDDSSSETDDTDCELPCGGDCCEVGREECIVDVCLPLCPSNTRCGEDKDICCDAGDVCWSGDQCITPDPSCTPDGFDCPKDFFCEPTLEKCLPVDPDIECEIIPEFEDVVLDTIEWSYTDAQIISIPLVADLDGDGSNEVIVNTTNENNGLDDTIEWGFITILDAEPPGETAVVERILDGSKSRWKPSMGRSTIAIGDVSGDGKPDIIYAGVPTTIELTRDGDGRIDYTGHDSLIYAYDFANDELLWTSHTGGPDTNDPDYSEERLLVHNGAITLANLDDDEASEVVIGSTIIDDDGEVVWAGNPSHGSPANPQAPDYHPGDYAGAISAVVDLDGDRKPEIVSGRQAWKIKSWTRGRGIRGAEAAARAVVEELWNADDEGLNPGVTISDGYPAIADLDLDDDPEIILVADGYLVILESDGKLWCGKASCADPNDRTGLFQLPGTQKASAEGDHNYGGPPTVSDFDGDGRPEIGVADYATYSVYDLNRVIDGVAEDIPSIAIPPKDSLRRGDIFTRWRYTTQDVSSSATGSSVFDFNGDRRAEVVYADECYVYVLDGVAGGLVSRRANSTGTIHDYPLVVDVDKDDHSEVLVVANDAFRLDGPSCPARTNGLFVFGDKGEGWIPTRPVWTQHTYHVTNADAMGNPPVVETDNWTTTDLNNYRQNAQGWGAFNAPDLTVEVTLDKTKCGKTANDSRMQVVATIRNQGARGVKQGVDVHFSWINGSDLDEFDVIKTKTDLLPGQSEIVISEFDAPPGMLFSDVFVSVDGTNVADGDVDECVEDNNGDDIDKVFCKET